MLEGKISLDTTDSKRLFLDSLSLLWFFIQTHPPPLICYRFFPTRGGEERGLYVQDDPTSTRDQWDKRHRRDRMYHLLRRRRRDHRRREMVREVAWDTRRRHPTQEKRTVPPIPPYLRRGPKRQPKCGTRKFPLFSLCVPHMASLKTKDLTNYLLTITKFL